MPRNINALNQYGKITPNQMARFTKTSRPTVMRWIDLGELDYLVPPGTRETVISARSAVEFMKKHALVVPAELEEIAKTYDKYFVGNFEQRSCIQETQNLQKN